MSGAKSVHHQSAEQMSRSDLVEFLRRLADRVESGAIVLRDTDEFQKLRLPEQVELKMKYQTKTKKKTKAEKHELEFEISWGDLEAAGGGIGLK